MHAPEAKAEAATKAEAEAGTAGEEAADEARRAASAVEAAEAGGRGSATVCAERRTKETPEGRWMRKMARFPTKNDAWGRVRTRR